MSRNKALTIQGFYTRLNVISNSTVVVIRRGTRCCYFMVSFTINWTGRKQKINKNTLVQFGFIFWTWIELKTIRLNIISISKWGRVRTRNTFDRILIYYIGRDTQRWNSKMWNLFQKKIHKQKHEYKFGNHNKCWCNHGTIIIWL